jgi:hypothetical protein
LHTNRNCEQRAAGRECARAEQASRRPLAPAPTPAMSAFEELGVAPELIRAISQLGWT